jgi:hypothetical protein
MNGWPSVEWAETLMQVIGPEQDGHLGGGLVGPSQMFTGQKRWTLEIGVSMVPYNQSDMLHSRAVYIYIYIYIYIYT